MNWSGKHDVHVSTFYQACSEEDVQVIVSSANTGGGTLRVAGAGHSHAPLVPTNDSILDLSGLSGVVGFDAGKQTARVWAGTPIHALGRPLHGAGLGLINQGDIDRQTIAGAIATGTHGTGRGLKNLSASVVGATIILASGERITCNATTHGDLWHASRLGLGAFGVVTQLDLQVREAYKLEESGWSAPFEEVLPKLDELTRATRHFEFFWSPETDQVLAKAIVETDKPPAYPLAQEGARCAWSYEVLPNHRPHLHTEMEYSVPEDRGTDCLSAIRALIHADFPDLKWPVEYRTLAADDVWLSTAFERQTVTISVHQGIDQDDEPLFRACENIFLEHEGRPHWGKVHYLTGDQLRACHPKWNDWWQVRDRYDPKGLFLNDHLQSLRTS